MAGLFRITVSFLTYHSIVSEKNERKRFRKSYYSYQEYFLFSIFYDVRTLNFHLPSS